MYIINYIPDGELNKNGHYRLQEDWLSDLISRREYTVKKIKFRNIISVLIKIWKQKVPILMPNCSLYDRFSLLDTLLVLITPRQRKIVVIHTVSKINFLNFIFCRVVRNCHVYVYSNSLKTHLERYGTASSVKVILAQYPNAKIMSTILLNECEQGVREYSEAGPCAIIWGNAARKLDVNRLTDFIESTAIDRVIIVGNDSPRIRSLRDKFSSIVEVVTSATDGQLVQLLKVADINLIFLEDKYDFYKSKRAASGVYLTALKFGLPSVISGELGELKDEILSDCASQEFSINAKSNFDIQTSLSSNVVDPFFREEMSLEFFDS